MSDPIRLSTDELKTLFLFESLEPERLQWLAERGRVETRKAGTMVFSEGEDATCFFVLLKGTLAMRRRVGETEVEINRTDHRGVYSGAIQALLRTEELSHYAGSMEAITDCDFVVWEAAVLGPELSSWFPMATHLLEGLMNGMRNSQEIIGQRERLLSLGRLSAGLTHELNNPAAAAVRATASLRERVAKMRRKLAHLAGGHIPGDLLRALTDIQEEAVERLPKAPKLTPMEASDAEDEISDWLEDRGLDSGWEVAPTLVASGVTIDWLQDRLVNEAPPEFLANSIHWLAYSLETELLMNEIEDATHRISSLIGAAKQYSQMDRAAEQDTDVHEGLDSTLIMLGSKFKHTNIVVDKDYDRTLPAVPAFPGELNQVWTNLIDNAIQAMGDSGTLTVRTSRDRDFALIEIADTGAGIPEGIQQKIFEPFFTTKAVGEGTGLGLDISYRIVVRRHHGDLSVKSEPGNTRFQVRLPLA